MVSCVQLYVTHACVRGGTGTARRGLNLPQCRRIYFTLPPREEHSESIYFTTSSRKGTLVRLSTKCMLLLTEENFKSNTQAPKRVTSSVAPKLMSAGAGTSLGPRTVK